MKAWKAGQIEDLDCQALGEFCELAAEWVMTDPKYYGRCGLVGAKDRTAGDILYSLVIDRDHYFSDEVSGDIAECQNCETFWPIECLLDVADLHERVDPGEEMPAGECPSCGAVCHLEEDKDNKE